MTACISNTYNIYYAFIIYEIYKDNTALLYKMWYISLYTLLHMHYYVSNISLYMGIYLERFDLLLYKYMDHASHVLFFPERLLNNLVC